MSSLRKNWDATVMAGLCAGLSILAVDDTTPGMTYAALCVASMAGVLLKHALTEAP